eukprot:TRINITY_DN6650_c0_g1_i3.p1 TRINITY_DN6650_c0_g1~~TRINITY_DN6650_c0_g1_i3.p1  ORF type:complete len:138 (+),score=5.67 TRINITY_DN6650_c0_g1_i3:1291-1704(+)
MPNSDDLQCFMMRAKSQYHCIIHNWMVLSALKKPLQAASKGMSLRWEGSTSITLPCQTRDIRILTWGRIVQKSCSTYNVFWHSRDIFYVPCKEGWYYASTKSTSVMLSVKHETCHIIIWSGKMRIDIAKCLSYFLEE